MFQLPDNHSTYVRQIKLRCQNLVTYGFWDGLDPENLRLWWRNFETEEELYFAASILDSLVYRSDKQVGAMIFELFSRKIPNILYRRTGLYDADILARLTENWKDPGIRISAPLFADPGQSGHQILRELKRKWVKKKWVINPSEIKTAIESGINTVFIVDDFCGTGSQLQEFIEENNLETYINDPECKLVFAHLCSHEVGRKYLKDLYPNMLLTSSEFIKKEYSCFDTLNDGLNNPQDVKDFYLGILKKMGVKRPKKDRTYGRGNLEIAYVFQQAVPNNSLSVLYHDENWNPLFRR